MEKTGGKLDSLRITVLAEDSVLYESPYLGQHGLSFLLEGRRGETIRRILVDVGQNPQALLHNMRIMNILPAAIDAIVLTHCHYDHTRGIVAMLKEIGKRELPVIAHPDVFRTHFVVQPYLRHVGVMQGDSGEDIEEAGGRLYLTKDPLEMMPGIVTTGEVKRQTDFEDVGIELKTIEAGRIRADPMLDDISAVANVKEKGLVVVTGCSHAGVINIVRHAKEITGCDRIEGIVGGLHLVDAPDARTKRTVEELSRLNPKWIWAGHCTGFKAQVGLYLALGDRFSPLHTGMKLEL